VRQTFEAGAVAAVVLTVIDPEKKCQLGIEQNK